MTAGSAPVTVAVAADQRWWEPSGRPALGDDDVHLWQAHVDDPGWPATRLARLLSADEQSRAQAFAFERDRRRFVVRRGLLRMLLAGYTDEEPDALRLDYGANGKPEVRRDDGDVPVRFSCSHSRGFAVCAFARARRVGVDVEVVRPVPDADGIAELCFSAREKAALRALSGDRRTEAFLVAWTCKEAYVKAVGDGLARPLDGVEVTIAPRGPPSLQAVDGDPTAAMRWSLRALTPAPGCVGTLAVEGHGPRVSSWHLVPGTGSG